MRGELCGKIMTRFIGFRAKTYIYLMDDSSEDKITKTVQKQNNLRIK